MCVDWEESTAGVAFSVRNSLPTAISLLLTFPELENLESSLSEGAIVVVGASASEPVARLTVRDPTLPHLYDFRWHFWLGDPKARHDGAARYRMPFGGGAPRRLSQGANGKYSHRGEYAFDFLMPIGTPVLAAREGIVVWVVDRSSAAAREEPRRRGERGDRGAPRRLARPLRASLAWRRRRRGAAVATGDRLGPQREHRLHHASPPPL